MVSSRTPPAMVVALILLSQKSSIGNNVILGDSELPERPPTLREMGHDTRPIDAVLPNFLVRLRQRINRAPLPSILRDQLQKTNVLSTVASLRYIDRRFAEPDTASHDIYLVCRPHRFAFSSFQHWSFYSQGHYYHLSAPQQPRELVRASRGLTTGEHVGILLKHEDYTLPDAAQANPHASRILVAYQVGQTDYRHAQLLAVATHIVGRMDAYDLLTANCQNFVCEMLARCVMRQRDRSAFVGTAAQIAQWDMHTKHAMGHQSSVSDGFVVADPRPCKHLADDVSRSTNNISTDFVQMSTKVR